MKVGIIDYGAGNLQSVLNAFLSIGADAQLITSPESLPSLTHLVLPGQGEFGDCSAKLKAAGMFDSIKQWITDDKPFLGICVGYQLLFEGSDESPAAEGLGIFKGQVIKFKNEPQLKIPHMGWNEVIPTQLDHPIWNGMSEKPYFYYVHSYFPSLADLNDSASSTTYGSQTFQGSVCRGNLIATQFHPEKSQHAGLQLLKNFLALT